MRTTTIAGMPRARRNYRMVAHAAATLGCAAAAAATLADLHAPWRSGLVAAMLVAGVGWASTSWIDIPDAAYAGTVALATGLSVVFLYALLFVEIGWWHPIGSVAALLAGAAVVNAGALVRDTFRRVAR